MKAGKAIYQILKANSGVTAIIGSGSNARIYPVRIPETGSFPAIQYQQISVVPSSQKTGPAKGDFSRVQVNCYATTYKACHDLADAVRSALESYSGTTSGSIIVHYVELVSATDTVDDGAQFSGIYYVNFDFIVNYNA